MKMMKEFLCFLSFFLFTAYGSTPTTTGALNATTTTTTLGCSASRSYVAVYTDLLITLTSAQALFPPYTYQISPSNLVILANSGSGCDIISTNVTDKIVMFWESEHNSTCTEQSKVLQAQLAGAKGVLIASNNGVNIVQTIPIDSNSASPSIPARMITQQDGWNLVSYLQEDSSILVEFGCFNTSDPQNICIKDGSTNNDYWYLDGEYQLQVSSYNDHSVYYKESYIGVVYGLYLYFDTVWKLGWELNSSSETMAYCNVTTEYPYTCPLWYTSNGNSYSKNSQFYVNNTLCQLSNSYICISSDSCVGGLNGTYRQLVDGMGLWVRELTSYDMSPGYLLYTSSSSRRGQMYRFVFVSSMTNEVEGYCYVDTRSNPNAEFEPQKCSPWYIRNDNEQFEYDSTFTIKNQECSGYDSSTQYSENEIPSAICLVDQDGYHSFLEGTYYLYENTSVSTNGYPIYQLSNPADNLPAYVFFYSNASDYHLWLIANSTPNTNYATYAYCAAQVKVPTECAGKWNFYFSGSFDADCDAVWTNGECTSTTMDPDNLIIPNDLCVNSQVYDYMYPDYIGTYKIASDLKNGRHYWVLNNSANSDMYFGYQNYYIWYDSTYKYWSLGSSFSQSSTVIICTEDKYYNPANCSEWLNYYEGQNLITVTGSECSDDNNGGGGNGGGGNGGGGNGGGGNGGGGNGDGLSSGSSTSSSDLTLSIVLPILILLLCFGVVWYMIKKKRQQQYFNFQSPNQEELNNNGHARLESKSMELNTVPADTTGGHIVGEVALPNNNNENNNDNSNNNNNTSSNYYPTLQNKIKVDDMSVDSGEASIVHPVNPFDLDGHRDSTTK